AGRLVLFGNRFVWEKTLPVASARMRKQAKKDGNKAREEGGAPRVVSQSPLGRLLLQNGNRFVWQETAQESDGPLGYHNAHNSNDRSRDHPAKEREVDAVFGGVQAKEKEISTRSFEKKQQKVSRREELRAAQHTELLRKRQ
ncbi:unnamed protein product, partial [Amoebophrya sp. A120]